MSRKPKNLLDLDEDSSILSDTTASTPAPPGAPPMFPGLPAHLEAILKAPTTAKEAPSSTGHTFRVEPSPLLAKLNAFLPEMRRANEELEMRIAVDGAECCSVEIPSAGGSHVEMGITLGILEERMDDTTPTKVVLPSDMDTDNDEVAATLDQLLFAQRAETAQPISSVERDEDELVTLTAPTKAPAANGSASSLSGAARVLRSLGFAPVGDVSAVGDDALSQSTRAMKIEEPVPLASARVLVQEVDESEAANKRV